MQRSGLQATVGGGDADCQIVRRVFCVFDLDIEVAAVVEHAGVSQLEFAVVLAAAAVFFDEPRVGIFGLWIFIQAAEVTAGGCGVEIVVAFLNVFAVVALAIGQAEQALFENGIAAVPEGERKTDPAFAIGDAKQAIFTPAVGTTAGVIVREILPAVAVSGIVFADSAPLALGKVWTPAFPVYVATDVFGEAKGFGVHAGVQGSGSGVRNVWGMRNEKVEG